MNLEECSQTARVLMGRMDTISHLMEEREALSSNGWTDDISRIRMDLRQLDNDTGALENDFGELYPSGSASERECGNMIANLRRRIKNAMDSLSRVSGRQNSSSGQHAAANSNRGQSHAAKLAQQDQTMAEQDKDLERMHASIRNLKLITTEIHGELEAQDPMLAALADKVVTTNAAIESTDQRTQEHLKKNKRCCIQ